MCTMIFVLSAIHPDKMLRALQHVHRCLRPGGRILFRDYGVYDMAQVKRAWVSVLRRVTVLRRCASRRGTRSATTST